METTDNARHQIKTNVLELILIEDLGPLFQRSTIPTNPNPSTVARICTVNFRNSGPSK